MSIQRKHGQWGEDLAVACLRDHGYEILFRNWRHKHAEIDIIGRENGILVFVEVKMRASAGFGRPEAMISRRKKRLLIDAAMAFMRSIGYDWEIRFDVISILGRPEQGPELTLFRDAFFPDLNYRG
jgi:putative endonuclease